MNEINIQFLSDEAVGTIKGNLDLFTRIAKKNPLDATAFLAELPEDSFIDKKYRINDFELKCSEDGDYAKVDFDNTILLYERLKELPKHVLGDERFWLWVILKKGYSAAVQAMPLESGKNVIRDHWTFYQGRRRGLMFGVLSRCFFRGMLTVDEKDSEPYKLTYFATQSYARYRELTWRSYSNNKIIVCGALKAEMRAVEKYGEQIEGIKDYYPSIAKYISQLGSVMLLDFMTEEYITDSVMEYCDRLAGENKIVPIKK